MTIFGLVAHECGHLWRMMNDPASDGEGAIRNEGLTHLSTWSREPSSSAIERLSYVAAGPLVDLLSKRIIGKFDDLITVNVHLSRHLKHADDGTLDCDSRRWARLSAELNPAEIYEALRLALHSAIEVFELSQQVPSFFTDLAALMDALEPEKCIVLKRTDFEALKARRFPIRPTVRNFHAWLAEGGATDADHEEEMKAEAMAILAEMTAAGEIADGAFTAAGFARLDLHEGRR